MRTHQQEIESDRGNHPSCSGLERMSLCPGSWLASQGLPDKAGPDATRGTRIHAWLEGQTIELKPDEMEDALELSGKAAAVMVQVFGCDDPVVQLEQRLWSRGLVTFSGQADYIGTYHSKALILDYKTGRGDVTPAHSNLQGKGLAFLAMENNPFLEEVHVAFIQVGAKPEIATFPRSEALNLYSDITDVIVQAQKPLATLTAGEKQCKYCKLAATCPAVHQTLAEVEKTPAIALLDNADISALLGKLAVVERLCDKIREAAKERILDGQEIAGYYLKEGNQRREIIDANAAFNLLHNAHGMDEATFTGCCSVSVSKLEKALAQSAGLKAVAAKQEIDSLLGSVMEVKTNAPSLARTKS